MKKFIIFLCAITLTEQINATAKNVFAKTFCEHDRSIIPNFPIKDISKIREKLSRIKSPVYFINDDIVCVSGNRVDSLQNLVTNNTSVKYLMIIMYDSDYCIVPQISQKTARAMAEKKGVIMRFNSIKPNRDGAKAPDKILEIDEAITYLVGNTGPLFQAALSKSPKSGQQVQIKHLLNTLFTSIKKPSVQYSIRTQKNFRKHGDRNKSNLYESYEDQYVTKIRDDYYRHIYRHFISIGKNLITPIKALIMVCADCDHCPYFGRSKNVDQAYHTISFTTLPPADWIDYIFSQIISSVNNNSDHVFHVQHVINREAQGIDPDFQITSRDQHLFTFGPIKKGYPTEFTDITINTEDKINDVIALSGTPMEPINNYTKIEYFPEQCFINPQTKQHLHTFKFRFITGFNIHTFGSLYEVIPGWVKDNKEKLMKSNGNFKQFIENIESNKPKSKVYTPKEILDIIEQEKLARQQKTHERE
ncbi:MAG: hypothetical protein E7015_03010 [Alphaproteobacteria bacterium]|nr:hypothetical protein [Alphaproteobacteria bacterium]